MIKEIMQKLNELTEQETNEKIEAVINNNNISKNLTLRTYETNNDTNTRR